MIISLSENKKGTTSQNVGQRNCQKLKKVNEKKRKRLRWPNIKNEKENFRVNVKK